MFKQPIKSAARRGMARFYQASGYYLRHLRGKALILGYHRVLPESELGGDRFIQPGMYVRNDVFEQHIRFLTEHFHVISFGELLDLWERKTWDNSKRYCVVTFDDGWLDNYVHAFPILKKYRVPATIFLPTSLIGTNRWFWPDSLGYLLKLFYSGVGDSERSEWEDSFAHKYPWVRSVARHMGSGDIDSAIESCKTVREETIYEFIADMDRLMKLRIPDERSLVNWQEVEEMSQHGISFGSHSCTHQILTELDSMKIQHEVQQSLGALTSEKIHHIPVFAYPNGSLNDRVVCHVKTAGYRAAVTTSFGFEDQAPENRFRLKRVLVHNDISLTQSLFAFHISGLSRLLSSTYGTK